VKDLLEIAENIQLGKDGIYFAKTHSKISYPEEGNVNCFQLEQDSFWFNHRNKVILEAVNTYSKNKTFFDIGGGNGFVAKGLQENGQDVVLIEPGVQGAKYAKLRNVNQVICATLEDAHFKKESIDSAGMFDVVEHIEDDLGFLKNIHTYLKKDGIVYISVPAFNLLWSNEDDDAGHFRRYTLKTAEQVLIKAGFKPLYSTYFFSPLVLPIFLFRSIPSKLRVKRKSHDLKKYQKEHQQRGGIVNALLERVWKWELKRIKNKKRIPFGSSCFLIAQKNK
tara:strand:- start:2663 stop:3499 length:837 start_codon:yes stop_codon:yes gene_type:complete